MTLQGIGGDIVLISTKNVFAPGARFGALPIYGFQVFDLGTDVPTPKFVEKAREVNADIVGLSALLTTTMTAQRDVIEALDDAGLRKGRYPIAVKVMVGGAPVTRSWAAEIGAEGYSEDAIGAVAIAKQLMGI